ncbi:BON domain-containing protein [Paraburkholderia lycopersici]|uniref:Osmotically-inducible protein OsmY, contains BON domain n=1 Tax=Paraburkholderia lycopersici TaxID=416944 RepID=A0A1G7CXP0_9BURK|nr:BON domain-containing protein [Paraburkholderia lycopersici]SDE44021.1 Osmotically-inducible protein OsmY, contains BON domain [Paraburkholderia lycopersici]
MKSDEALREDVVCELLWDPAIDAARVEVGVQDRIVTLSGAVPSYAQKMAIQRAVERVAGCRAIAIELTIEPPPAVPHPDVDLAEAIALALRWQAGLAETQVHVEVERGCVTLSGVVDWGYQRNLAEKVVSRMRGVMGVTNEVAVRNSGDVAHVAEHISAALARRAQREFAGIHITVENGVATLSGTVSSLRDRRAACGATWATRGVRRVVDKLIVE